MNRYSLVGLSLVAGILSALAWTNWCSGLILLFSFVPFLIIEEHIFRNPARYTPNACFIYLLPGFVLFNILSLGWMRVASMTGAISVIMGLSFLMAFTLWLSHVVRIRAGNIAGFATVVLFWLGLELISLNVNVVTPWMNLGNGLAKDIRMIQWYDHTGVAGGSLWILLSNLFLSRIIMAERKIILLIIWLIIIILPVYTSTKIYSNLKPSECCQSEVVIVQPDIDPYTEKFLIPFEVQLENVISMASSAVSEKTDWIVTPETTVDDPVNLDASCDNMYIKKLRSLAEANPRACIVAGLVSYKLYPALDKPPTPSARKLDSSGLYYDHFNSAFKIDTGSEINVYHKSKLVPGIEMQFSNGPGRFISKILPYLGGTKWGYGIQNERSVFKHPSLQWNAAPVICYESVFGSYVTGYVKNGAGALFIITNDGWWKNTNGYKQHLNYASLRAIETRRPVIRSANTGISCIIDIKGNRTAESGWWTREVLKGNIIPENRITAYVKYDDYILRISSLASVIIILTIFVAVPLRKNLKQIAHSK